MIVTFILGWPQKDYLLILLIYCAIVGVWFSVHAIFPLFQTMHMYTYCVCEILLIPLNPW